MMLVIHIRYTERERERERERRRERREKERGAKREGGDKEIEPMMPVDVRELSRNLASMRARALFWSQFVQRRVERDLCSVVLVGCVLVGCVLSVGGEHGLHH